MNPKLFVSVAKNNGALRALGSNQGFSLLEMLVALVILSLSLSALYHAAIGATRNMRVASEYTDAVMLAESVLTDHSYITNENYSASGRFQQLDWEVISWPVVSAGDSEVSETTPQPGTLQYLQVTVSWPGRDQPRTLDLLTILPLRQAVE